ncbi:hypothetical protein EUTSA_v10026848mg [Eutrema salsugineum]|uniref:Defensin-like protein n=1 Tax=Eutrema salsugineum TaxID=72664 RepID=V4P437_EUTSA|nr:defensin-like protein 183 [Eutrema salsugineum]ESQ54216.1 hypothetical protein EUTSA_v10026848mg [Eutrema salsugineum]
MKNAFSLVVFITFFIMLASVNKVKANICQDALGACPQCDVRCKAKHGPAGQGSCDNVNQLCTCNYTCGPPNPQQSEQCYGLFICTDACNQNCAQKYLGGSGFCESIGNTKLCKCQYPC